MAKNIKLNIKNTQIAEAVNLSGLKGKLAKKKAESAEAAPKKTAAPSKGSAKTLKTEETPKEEAPLRIRARSKSAFAEPHLSETSKESHEAQPSLPEEEAHVHEEVESIETPEPRMKTSAEIRRDLFGDDNLETLESPVIETKEKAPTEHKSVERKIEEPIKHVQQEIVQPVVAKPEIVPQPAIATPHPLPVTPEVTVRKEQTFTTTEKLGPTGRHMRDFVKPKPAPQPIPQKEPVSAQAKTSKPAAPPENETEEARAKRIKIKEQEEEAFKKGSKTAKFKDFKDVKQAPRKGVETSSRFDARDRLGLRATDEEGWRRKRPSKMRQQFVEEVIRPTTLSIRTPISIKDLASEMKLKASQLIGKLFLQGVVVTLNDLLEDETTIQLLGSDFGCNITIDKTEEKRVQITDKTIREELQQVNPEQLQIRPPVVAFMGHVDHGKTSLIDAIRKSNRVAGEAGAITQHIGAFRCKTAVGDITVLDTPGHEAFSAMRARGADVTDIVVLVVAGDEGLRQQTIEAIQHARAAKVTIVVAINKADKPNFNAETVYRQLAENDLLPESWGGQTITVNCSAVTGQGIPELLEMLALQSEILELRADPTTRARGTVLESEMHKGLGHVATILVQNGTLRRGDALVFAHHWGRVKTMYDEFGRELEEAGPSTPVEITGMSGLPDAGQEFIVVKSEKEAREISAIRSEGARQNVLTLQQKKKVTMENLFQQASDSGKKILNIILRADVQGSLEALKVALLKIESDKADINIIFTGVGEVTESDVSLAAASKAVIIGFHTQIESHAESLVKQLGIQVRLHDIIYHAIDEVKLIMAGLLDKLAQENEKGKAFVKATFKSSQAGIIAGCQVTEGVIQRNNQVRVKRGDEVIWKGSISSLKRVKDDVREVQKGMECGIILSGFSALQENDIIEAYEITYISQEL